MKNTHDTEKELLEIRGLVHEALKSPPFTIKSRYSNEQLVVVDILFNVERDHLILLYESDRADGGYGVEGVYPTTEFCQNLVDAAIAHTQAHTTPDHKEQWEVTVIFPLFTNDGREQSEKVDALIQRVCAVTGGVSAWTQDGIELWDDGILPCPDVSKRVVTTCNERKQVKAVRDIALDAIELLEQTGGVFFQVHTVTCEWLDRGDIDTFQQATVTVINDPNHTTSKGHLAR